MHSTRVCAVDHYATSCSGVAARTYPVKAAQSQQIGGGRRHGAYAYTLWWTVQFRLYSHHRATSYQFSTVSGSVWPCYKLLFTCCSNHSLDIKQWVSENRKVLSLLHVLQLLPVFYLTISHLFGCKQDVLSVPPSAPPQPTPQPHVIWLSVSPFRA